jgi:hypothetical protein
MHLSHLYIELYREPRVADKNVSKIIVNTRCWNNLHQIRPVVDNNVDIKFSAHVDALLE